MTHKAKVAVCSDIRTKHSTQSERHVEFLNVKSVKPFKPARFLKVISQYMSEKQQFTP